VRNKSVERCIIPSSIYSIGKNLKQNYSIITVIESKKLMYLHKLLFHTKMQILWFINRFINLDTITYISNKVLNVKK